MRQWFDLAWKTMWRKKRRTIFSLLGVVAGVALLISLLLFQGRMEGSLEQQRQQLYGDVEMMAGYRHVPNLLAEEDLRKFDEVAGIRETGLALVNPRLYRPADPSDPAARVFYVGVDNSRLVKSFYKYERDLQPGEAVVSETFLAAWKVKVGDHVRLPLSGGGFFEAKIVDKIGHGGVQGAKLPEMVYVPLEVLQAEFGIEGFNLVVMDLEEGVRKTRVQADLRAFVRADLDVDRMEALDQANRNAEAMKVMGWGVGVLALVAGGLLMMSNFQLSLKERIRELATLRAVGATPKQVFRLVMLEAAFSGVAGVVLGTAAGLGLADWLIAWLAGFLEVELAETPIPWGTLAAVVAGVLAGLLVMTWWPLRQVLYITPLQAARETEEQEQNPRRHWLGWALAMMLLGAVLAVVGANMTQQGASAAKMMTATLGGLLFVVGTYWGIPAFAKPVLRVLSPVAERIGGRMAFVAVQNLIAERRQSSVTIRVIAISLTLLVTMTTFHQSLLTKTESDIRRLFASGNVVVKESGRGDALQALEQRRQFERIPGVESVLPYSSRRLAVLHGYDYSKADPEWYAENAGRPEPPFLEDRTKGMLYYLADLKALQEQGLLPKWNGELREAVVFSAEHARHLGVKEGDRITVSRLGRPGTEQVTLTVGAVVEKLPGPSYGEDVYVDWSNSALEDNAARSVEMFVLRTKEEHQQAVVGQVKTLLMQEPDLNVVMLEAMLKENFTAFGQQIVLIGSVVGVILLVGLLGLVNTLSASLHAKRREFAVLRAISISGGQLIRIILTQTLLLAALAIGFGLATGYVMGFAFLMGLDMDAAWIVVPWLLHAELVGALLVIVLGIGYALARRFVRRSVLQGMSME